ncbi:MAG: phosphoribosylanthranilate isomerase [Oscillospiraceae bacterium]|nr:phosphoribosylanthranilate isomerase [Oscillospiraceae bacterium]
MTKIKLCGLRREADIAAANELMPDYAGFVLARESRRAVSREQAAALRALLRPEILAVGVFVDAPLKEVESLLSEGILDIAQLHGREDGDYVKELQTRTGKPVIQAFRIRSREDAARAAESPADYILLDAGAGDGETFPWELAEGAGRPYFLAGGLTAENVPLAVERLHPFAVDVSSGIETDGWKDPEKMRAFVRAVRRRTEA